ncbi:Actin-like protein ARP6 [Vanrija pseudolonga]|uniref:Actin-like protein ARP6 n=1 Tax=Vanrija pseudolonga TaxID=143232 RepID=A0AAF1BK24_9TREE|nr:Actin-like protein ARP6 [Vanrija pseudolonga]
MAQQGPVLIFDNGAYTIKAGISGVDEEPRFFPNSIVRSRADKRLFVSDDIENCRDLSGAVFRRPFERGMLVSWDAEKMIWDHIFSSSAMDIKPPETSLLVTEPYFNLPNIAETYDQMVFEEWEFSSYYRCTPASLIPYGGLFSNEADIPPECMIVVDVGYSFTHIVPIRGADVLWDHVKRIDVGGKLLTNHLKHLISFRQWNMLDQTYVVNSVREACSYVSMDWRGDLEKCKRSPRANPIVQEYVLPDFSAKSLSRTGYIRSGPNAVAPPEGAEEADGSDKPKRATGDEEEQVLWMENERFAGNELLFHPSDIGLNQTGLPETIAYVISTLPPDIQGMFWANIGIIGGLGNVEALGERLERDLRALCPIDYELGIYEVYEPTSAAYQAAVALTSNDVYLSSYAVTRAEYQEHGSSICRRKFGGPAYNVDPPGFTRDGGEPVDEHEQELRYALGLDSIKGKGSKRRNEDQEVTSGNWGGRRRRAQEGAGLLGGRGR